MMELKATQHTMSGSIRLSGSKSISNRLLIINSVLHLNLIIENLSDSEDTILLQKALAFIKDKTKAEIDIHHAGTDMRFLTALLSVTEGEWIITGSERMKERPVGELVNALRSLGADISYLEKENFPPLRIAGKKLQGGRVEIDSSISSQFISALLLIAPVFEIGLTLHLKNTIVSKAYIGMTIALLEEFGMEIKQSASQITVAPKSNREDIHFKTPSAFVVESDWSSASYWYSMCALSGRAEIELRYLNKNSLQADSALPEIFKLFGVTTSFKENSILLSGTKPAIAEFSHDFTNCPDIAQTLAVTCFGLGIKAQLNGLSTLKVKETDRILALKNELEKFGAQVDIGPDSVLIHALADSGDRSRNQEPEIINTYNDHRMAMSFAPLALKYESLRIDDPRVVNKSYPAFWEDLKSVGFNVNLQA